MTDSQIVTAIDERRKALGLSVTELALRADLARPGVSKALHGRKKPCLASVVKMARAVGLTLILRV